MIVAGQLAAEILGVCFLLSNIGWLVFVGTVFLLPVLPGKGLNRMAVARMEAMQQVWEPKTRG